MNNSSSKFQPNPLGIKEIPELLKAFAVPSIIAMLVSSLYNVVDQFFIGQAIGELGNAATNVVYPLVPACISCALLFGIGGASNFNLSMGKGDRENAGFYLGNAATAMVIAGLIISVFSQISCDSLLRFLGSPENVFPLAKSYLRITAVGFPFQIFAAGSIL